jgi:hypothetical protein
MKILRRYIFFAFFCSLFAASLTAQDVLKTTDRILFRGVVIAASSGDRLAGSQIFINRTFSTSSRNDGTFSFFAFRLDTVVFTMLGYKPEQLIVSDTLKAREFLTGVFMKTDTIEIGEVIILPRLPNLRADMMNIRKETNTQLDYAVSNVNIASYQGRTTQSKLGDPALNYDLIMRKQKISAFEKGGIPADQIAGINPFILIPAAYMLLHGKPDAPQPPEPRISQKDLDDLNSVFMQMRRGK